MGLRGPHANPLLSWGKPPDKPRRKRRCRRCNELFVPLRHDAKFCSAKCRQAVYWQRHLADTQPDDRPTFTLTLRPESGIDGQRATKALGKFVLQKFGLRVITVSEQRVD